MYSKFKNSKLFTLQVNRIYTCFYICTSFQIGDMDENGHFDSGVSSPFLSQADWTSSAFLANGSGFNGLSPSSSESSCCKTLLIIFQFSGRTKVSGSFKGPYRLIQSYFPHVKAHIYTPTMIQLHILILVESVN